MNTSSLSTTLKQSSTFGVDMGLKLLGMTFISPSTTTPIIFGLWLMVRA